MKNSQVQENNSETAVDVLDYEDVILSFKQRTYTIIAIICFACVIFGIVGSYIYDPAALHIYFMTGIPACLVVFVVLLLLRNIRFITWMERISAIAMMVYLLAWAVGNILAERIPTDYFAVSNTPVLSLAMMFLSLVVPHKWVFKSILAFFLLHSLLVWINLLQYPWSQLHVSQMVNDILMLTVVFTVSLIATYSHTLLRSQSDTQTMHELANTDVLTGLLNRRAMYRVLSENKALIIIQIDVDHFKKINDNFGHDEGDKALTLIAEHLQKGFAHVGKVARWGGEEFLVAIEGDGFVESVKQAEITRKLVSSSTFVCPITISMGVVQKQPHDNLDDALKRADKLLYQAKESGRNLVLHEESA